MCSEADDDDELACVHGVVIAQIDGERPEADVGCLLPTLKARAGSTKYRLLTSGRGRSSLDYQVISRAYPAGRGGYFQTPNCWPESEVDTT